jgi:two-component system, NtrC family, nitrogen regulation sensor histidine kinase NtrY
MEAPESTAPRSKPASSLGATSERLPPPHARLQFIAPPPPKPKSKSRFPHLPPLSYERRVWLLAILTGLPGALVALSLLWSYDYSAKVQWTLTVLILGFWFGFALALRERVVLPLQTLSNLLAALREGDYSIRGRAAKRDDTLGEVMLEVNALGATLRQQRLGAMEATALLRTVMAEIEVAVFTFDNEQRLRLVNRAGEKLLNRPLERLLGRSAAELGLADCLQGEVARTLQRSFPGGTGRWGMRRKMFRENGLPHNLIVVADLSRALREEEREAWQRLVRVLGHELNNSLAPIKSIAGSLESLILRERRPDDWEDDLQRGLSVIASRAESLSRFMSAYARLARLPVPHRQPLNVAQWVQQAIGIETRGKVHLRPGPETTINADRDQLDQLLINLLRNAVDATLETGGQVEVSWKAKNGFVEVTVVDEGPGLSNTSNLFVPFFTTKPGGSGIGLALSRQIAESHGGTLTLENRSDVRGCEARLRLPM